MINKKNDLASVLGDMNPGRIGENDNRKKGAMEADYQRINESKHNQMREDNERSKGLENCEVLVCLVLAFVVNCINNIKFKDLRVLLRYHFRSEKLKGGP